MHPIPFNPDHLNAIETAGAGGVSLTVSVPLGTARAGIVVLHEVWGLPGTITVLVLCLADCGYITAAPHLHHGRCIRASAPLPENPPTLSRPPVSATGVTCRSPGRWRLTVNEANFRLKSHQR